MVPTPYPLIPGCLPDERMRDKDRCWYNVQEKANKCLHSKHYYGKIKAVKYLWRYNKWLL